MDHEDDMDELHEPGQQAWGDRIRRERERRGWTQTDAISELRRSVRKEHQVELPDNVSLLRMWKRWERGGGIRADYQKFLADLFDSVALALFPPPRRIELLPDGDTEELLQRLQASSVDASSIDGLTLTVDMLCSDYPNTPAEQLLTEGRAWLARLVGLIQQPMTLAQRREVQVQAGWLALLVACVHHDLGEARRADGIRRRALSLGREAGHAGIQGWAHEIAAWQALTSGNPRGVLTAVEAGLAVAGHEGVAVQLVAQQAKALVRIGDHPSALRALDRGRRLLEPMPYPPNDRHHFVVDHRKYDFYAMDIYRMSSDDAAATQLAHEVLAAGTDPGGVERAVMRNSQARFTLATVAARGGDVETAIDWAERGLAARRQSLPSLLMIARDLVGVLDAVAPDARPVLAFHERLRELGGRP